MRTKSSVYAEGAEASPALLASGFFASGFFASASLSSGSPPSGLPPLDADEDQDTGDVPMGVNEDALEDDPLDTDQITDPDSQPS